MIYRDTRMYEYHNELKRDYIKQDLVDCYNKLNKGIM